MSDRKELRSLALACIGANARYPQKVNKEMGGMTVTIVDPDDLNRRGDADRAFRLAITPNVVLDLLDEIETLRKRVKND